MDAIHELVFAANKMFQDLQQRKPEFEAYISNKTIPLELRWNLWEEAPECLKNTSGDIDSLRFESFRLFGVNPDDAIGYEGEIYHAERYRTVYVEYILDALYEHEASAPDCVLAGSVDSSAIVAFKEEVLSKNIYSAVYDW